tara:strand:- start:733 stop:942 length:210 start_codon:yes stop_codon:yes gene_type:complete
MAINPVSISSQSIAENTDACIDVRYTEPPVGTILNPPETPNKLIGYYDGTFDVVRLYIVDDSGLRLLPL